MTTRDTVTTVTSYNSGRSSGKRDKTQYSSMGMSINPLYTILEKIAKCTNHVCEPRLCNPCGKRGRGKKENPEDG